MTNEDTIILPSLEEERRMKSRRKRLLPASPLAPFKHRWDNAGIINDMRKIINLLQDTREVIRDIVWNDLGHDEADIFLAEAERQFSALYNLRNEAIRNDRELVVTPVIRIAVNNQYEEALSILNECRYLVKTYKNPPKPRPREGRLPRDKNRGKKFWLISRNR